VPGFAVLFQAHFFGLAVGVETQHRLRGADFYGEDVPDIQRDYVGYQEVDVAAAVDGASFADGVGGAGFVGVGAEGVGGFGLDAEELASVVEDEVVALAVSPGAGDAESEAGGFMEEGGFAALSGALGVGAEAGLARGGDFFRFLFGLSFFAAGLILLASFVSIVVSTSELPGSTAAEFLAA